MKKKITKAVRSFGGDTHYQGSTKTMFVDEPQHWDSLTTLEELIKDIFQPKADFTIKSNSHE